MSSPARILLRELTSLRLRLSPVGNDIRIRGPRALITEDLKARIRAHKEELSTLLVAQRRATPIFVDFETRAFESAGMHPNTYEPRFRAINLMKIGGRLYAHHPGMEVLCCVMLLPDDTLIEWRPGDPPPSAAFALIEQGIPVVAHNAFGFDEFVWERLGWPAAKWDDSQLLAQILGLPAKLEEVAIALRLDTKKDLEGKRFTVRLGRPDRLGRIPSVSKADLERVVQYCSDDVRVLKAAWVHLSTVLRVEPEVRSLDKTINRRGIYFDSRLARGIMEMLALYGRRMCELAGIEPSTLRSGPQLKKLFVERHGIFLGNIQNGTLVALSATRDTTEEAQQLIEARLAIAGTTRSKLKAALCRTGEDGFLRDCFRYGGCHTGRWSAHGFQPQNLPRCVKLPEGRSKKETLESAITAVLTSDLDRLSHICAGLTYKNQTGKEVRVRVPKMLSSLIRPCIWAPPGRVLVWVDYDQIEARVLLWLARDAVNLDRYRTKGFCPYAALAARIFNMLVEDVRKGSNERQLGKAGVLGCGYGMGPPKFKSSAEEKYGVDWSLLTVGPDETVEAFRATYPAVAGYPVYRRDGTSYRQGGFWKDLEVAAMQAARGITSTVGPLTWSRWGSHAVCRLPSGRPLVYRRASIKGRMTPWGKLEPAFVYEEYKHGRGAQKPTWGGSLAENVTQAVARDILTHAMLQLERAGFLIRSHWHDEVTLDLPEEDGPRGLDQIRTIMETPPPWASDLPLRVSVELGQRYSIPDV